MQQFGRLAFVLDDVFIQHGGAKDDGGLRHGSPAQLHAFAKLDDHRRLGEQGASVLRPGHEVEHRKRFEHLHAVRKAVVDREGLPRKAHDGQADQGEAASIAEQCGCP